jgi:FtsP/CotA-like multicopper oxidase with cupredoxin domain
MDNTNHQSTYSTFPPLAHSGSSENINKQADQSYVPQENETESLLKRYPNTTSITPRDGDPRFMHKPDKWHSKKFEPVPRFSGGELGAGIMLGFMCAMFVLYAMNEHPKLFNQHIPAGSFNNVTDLNTTDEMFATPLFAFNTVPMFESENGTLQVYLSVVLKAQEYILDNGRVHVRFDARTFNESVPANGLLLSAGDKLEIWLSNELASDKTAVDDNDQSSTGKNELGWANITNIHSHGLHVSPAGESDNVFRVVKPSEMAKYTFDIPEDHSPGTAWMHPHYHGSSALQTAYAMAMPIVIRDPKGTLTDPLSNALDIVLLTQNINIGSGKSKDEQVIMKKAGSQVGRSVHTTGLNSGEHLDAIVVNGIDNPVVAVIPPLLLRQRANIDIGDVVRLRLINAAIDGVLVVILQVIPLHDVDVAGEEGFDMNKDKHMGMCEMWSIAKDGEYFDKPRPKHVLSRTSSSSSTTNSCQQGDSFCTEPVVLVPGSRVDLVVACAPGYEAQLVSSPGSLSTSALNFLGNETTMLNGTLASIRFTAMPIGDDDNVVEYDSIVDDLTNSAKGNKKRLGRHAKKSTKGDNGASSRWNSDWSPATAMRQMKLPVPITREDLRTVPDEEVVRFIFEWSHGGKQTPSLFVHGQKYTSYGVNGQRFTGQAVVQVRLNSVLEWVIVSKAKMDGSPLRESHPFHLHTNHFQVVSWVIPKHEKFPQKTKKTGMNVNDQVNNIGKSPDFEVGDWRDTIASAAPGNVTIRWRPKDFVGLTVAHCHVLVHEDTGMMIALEIVP